MKIGTEDRKKLILAGSLGVLALGTMIYEFAGSGSDTAAAPAATVSTVRPATPSPVAHVSNAALDPTLHPEGMEAAEALAYSGNGRNIFLAGAEPSAAVSIPKAIAPVRTVPVYTQPPNPGPPPLPPIDLRFFGTEQRQGSQRQAFFLKGDDVFIASEGEIVGRRYKVGAISANAVQVTDLTNHNTQLLPLVQQ